MKTFKFLFFLLAFACFSCSEDSGDSSADGLDTNNYYTLIREERQIDLHEMTVVRTEHGFRVGDKGYPRMWGFTFDDTGRFGEMYFKFTPLGYNQMMTRYSYPDFSSNYFDFNLISIDEVNKRVKFSFSGKLYQYLDNLDIERNDISGEFDLYYIDNVPLIPGLTNEALIDGDQWRQVSLVKREIPGGFETESKSDDAYKMIIRNNLGTAVGNYNFDAASTTNCVYLYKFNTDTRTYTVYNTAGTMTVTAKTLLSNQDSFTLTGNYNFTATNPNNSADVIQVTNGSFKVYR